MKRYWATTTVSVSLFRSCLFGLVVPKKVRESWQRRDNAQLAALDAARQNQIELRSALVEAQKESQERDSLHERNWLKQASVFSGIDLSYESSVFGRGEYENHALLCAKESYRRGKGYREFLDFYKEYQGIGRGYSGGRF